MSGGKMVFDPGRAQTGNEWIIYIVAGGLMLVNGFLPSPHDPHENEGESEHDVRKRTISSMGGSN
ncbi:MAG: hypothetical protein OHK0029_34890 [Armatimonadaceae bacterium]